MLRVRDYFQTGKDVYRSVHPYCRYFLIELEGFEAF